MKTYYECHVTIEPVYDDKLQEAKEIAARYKFKVADLLMKKRKEESEIRSDKDTFMTGHDNDRENLVAKMQHLIIVLKQNGFKVWRYKIEDVHLDSRIEDSLNLLGE